MLPKCPYFITCDINSSDKPLQTINFQSFHTEANVFLVDVKLLNHV